MTDFNEDEEDQNQDNQNQTKADVFFSQNFNKNQQSFSKTGGSKGTNEFQNLFTQPAQNDTLTSVSLLDITENVIAKPPPKRETDRKRRANPSEMMNDTQNTYQSGVRDQAQAREYNPIFGSRKSSRISQQSGKHSARRSKNNTPRGTAAPKMQLNSPVDSKGPPGYVAQKQKSKASFDDILAANDEEMMKSSQHQSTSDINMNDLSGQNLKMDTSIDKSKDNIPGQNNSGNNGQPQRDSTDTQKDALNRTEIQRLDGSDEKSSKSNKKSHKSQKSIRPQTLFNQSVVANGRVAPIAMVAPNEAINMSIQSQSALLNQSNLALQLEINKQKLMNQQRMLSQSMAAGKIQDNAFLQALKKQIFHLQIALKKETVGKFKILQMVSVLKTSCKLKDKIILDLLKEKGLDDKEASLELTTKMKALQDHLKSSKKEQNLEKFNKSLQLMHELKEKAKIQASFSVNNINNADQDQGDDLNRSSQNRTAQESHKTISPDDQHIPTQKIWMFEGSELDVSQSQMMQHNSLYWLEHQTSQVQGINKSLAHRYKEHARGQQDQSALNITGLNATTTNMQGNTMLNITNMTRAAKQNGQQDQSYMTKRHQGPPSQSRFINLQELTSLEDTSYLQQDAEVSGMLKDNFNKSINVTIDQKQMENKLDRSAIVQTANKNLDVGWKKKSDGEQPSSAELRAALNNELSQSMDESSQMIRLPPDSEAESEYTQPGRQKDVSQNLDLTGMKLLDNDTSALNNVSNLQDASGLDILSGDGDKDVPDLPDVQHQHSLPLAPGQMVDRNLTMEIIEEETETDIDRSTVLDDQSTPSPDGRHKRGGDALGAGKKQDVSALDQTVVSDCLSPKSANVNKLLSFFDKSQILDKTNIPTGSRDVSKIEDEAPPPDDEAEKRFMQNLNRQNYVETLKNKEQSQPKSFKIDSHIKIQKQVTLPKTPRAEISRRKSTMIKPSQLQMKNLLEKRKLEKSKDMDTSNTSLNSIIQRSKTIRHPSSSKKTKAAENDESMNKSQIGNQSQIIDLQRWKMKFDIIVEQQKSWLIEKKKLRNELKILTDKNFRLEAKVKELTETLDFADNFLQQNDISRINPNMVSNNNVTQITNMGNVFDKSMLGGFGGDNRSILFGGDNKSMLFGADKSMVFGDRGPTPAFQVSKPINQDETVMYKDSDISRNDIRSMIASNIRQIEEQNQMAEQQLQASFQQASFLLSNNNPYGDNSFNLTKDIFPAGQNNISSIGGLQNNNWLDQKSQIQQQERMSNDQYEIKETDQSDVINVNDPFAPNTLKNAGKSQSNPKSQTGRVSPSISSSQPEVQGDQDEVDLLKSATPAKKKDLRAQESAEQGSTPNIRTRTYRNANNGGFQQLPVSTLLNQKDNYEKIIQQKFIQRDQKLDNMLERKTADFADFQALQQENQKQQMEQQQPKSFSTLFSFFKTKMKDSEQLRNLENKLNQNSQNQSNQSHEQTEENESYAVRQFQTDTSVSLRKKSANKNDQPRQTAGFGPNLWKGSFNDNEDTPKSFSRSRNEGGGKSTEESGHSKRMTFNPEQFQNINNNYHNQSYQQSKHGEAVETQTKSEVWTEKSKADMSAASLDFNNIVGAGEKRESYGKPGQRNSNEQQSFISNIPRGHDASYIINQGNTSIISGNLSYADASFLAAGNKSNISGINISKDKSPFFADLKSKNEGQSKIAVQEFHQQHAQPSQNDISQSDPTTDSHQDILPPNRLTLGQDCIGVSQQEILDQQSFQEYQELQLQQQYLQEQQLKQQLLQQQLLQQQMLQMQQYGGGSFAAGPASFMGQTASFAHGGFSGYEGESLMMQQQMAAFQEKRRQQYQFQQMDKSQIKNQFLQVVGRGSMNPQERGSFNPQAQLQYNIQQPPINQQQYEQQQHQFQSNQGAPVQAQPRGSAKNFFGNLISQRRTQTQNQNQNQE